MTEPHGFPWSALDEELAGVRGVVVGVLPAHRYVKDIALSLTHPRLYLE